VLTQLKWEKKGQSIVQGLAQHLCCFGGSRTLPAELNHKQLEKDRGSFLTHLSMTFEAIVPFLRGFHLTIDQWRLGAKQGTQKDGDMN
jgi:hypothetical protein